MIGVLSQGLHFERYCKGYYKKWFLSFRILGLGVRECKPGAGLACQFGKGIPLNPWRIALKSCRTYMSRIKV